MERCDVAIVGAGLLGCFTARALSALRLNICVLEAREDVCTGVSRANTGVIYTGLDTKPGTLKAELCVRANRGFDRLCRELGVRFSRCGSLMVSFGPRGDEKLRKKLEQGRANGVEGLRFLTAAECYALEPSLGPGLSAGLYAPGTGTLDPWELCIAAFENARANGVRFCFNRPVTAMQRAEGGFRLETPSGELFARAVVNCAGLKADAVRELVCAPTVRIFPNAADYLVLDEHLKGSFRHVIFHEPEEKGKGLTLVPTVDGTLLVGPTKRSAEDGEAFASAAEGVKALRSLCAAVAPGLDLNETIRGFAALRPRPFAVRREGDLWVREKRSLSDFTVLEEDGLISLIGIKTPGLTCAAELGRYVAGKAAAWLGGAERNPDFDPVRPAPVRVKDLSEAARAALVRERPEYGEIVCRCMDLSRGEVLDAIRRGAATLDGVKRRCGSGMGRCQGARCMAAVLEALAEAQGKPAWDVAKDGPASDVLRRD